jgi:dienelactone hydrolase
MTLEGFTVRPFSAEDSTRDVYWGGSGPAVLMLTEMPGITPAVAAFARRVVDAGYSVAMPDLFGVVGRPLSTGYLAASFTKACVSREFTILATGKTSPITSWLRALVDHIWTTTPEDQRGSGIGVVGMCFTGGFGLALAVDPRVKVPVMSQPAMPLGITNKQKRDLHLSDSDLRIVKDRAARDEICVIGLRFTGDQMVPADRFARLSEELGDAFVGFEIDSGKGNPHGLGSRDHSVLTESYSGDDGHPTKAAFELVLSHFEARLKP